MLAAAEATLSGERRGVLAVLPFLGPAFIAAIAYVDPGNFATNMAGGAQYGYALLWVVAAANLMATLIQALSAKLGIATGRSLPEVCRDRFPFRVVLFLWLQAEAVAMATDLAEFVGAALGLQLVFGLPLWVSGILTGVAAFAILSMEVWGFRRLEATITAFVAVVVLAFCLEVRKSGPPAGAVARGFVPGLPGGSTLLAVGIVGATVMPHVIYLHSALTKQRIVGTSADARRRIFRFEIVDISIAMGLAGVVNLAMLATAASVFWSRGLTGAGGDLGQVFEGLNRYLGAHTGTHLRRRPAGVGAGVVLRGDHVRAGGDGGVHPPPDPGLRPPGDHHDPGPGPDRRRVQPDQGAGAEPGLPLLRDPVRAGPAGHHHP